MSLSDLGIKPEGNLPQPSPGGLSAAGAKKAQVTGALVLDEPLKTVSINGKKVTLKESIANALILANEDMKAETGKGIEITQDFRSGAQQAKIYGNLEGGAKGRVAPPGSSFHQTGQAIDVKNWEAAAPFLNKYNLENGLKKDDPGHFSIGEFSDKPPITTRKTTEEAAKALLSGEDTQSAASIAKEKLGGQAKGLAKFVGSLKNDKKPNPLNPFSDKAFTQGFTLLPKLIPALGAELFKRGYAVGDAAIDHIMAGKAILKMIAGQPVDQKELADLKSSNRDIMKSYAGLIELIPDVRTQFVGGMAKEIANTEERGGTPKEGLVRGAIQGTEQAVLIAVINRIFAKLTGADKDKLVKEAEAQGIKKADIDAIAQKKIPASETKKYLDASVKAQGSRDLSVQKATDMVGNDLKAAQKEIKASIDDYGSKIGDIASEIKSTRGKFSVSDLSDDLMKNMRDLNIKVKKTGTLDFSNSDIAGLPSDQSLIQSMWDKVKPTQFGGKVLNVRDAIALNRNIGNQIYSTNQTSALTASESVAARFRDAMKNKINEYATQIGRPELADYNQAYHELTGMESVLDKAIKSTGTKATEFIRRAYSNVSSQPKEILSQLEQISQKYGLKSGIGIYDKGNVAIATENVAGVQPPTSLGGITKQVGQDIIGTDGGRTLTSALNRGAYGLIQKGKEFLFGSSPTPVDTFRNLIDKGITPANMTPATGTLPDTIMRGLNIPGLLKGAAPSTILDKLQSVSIGNKQVSAPTGGGMGDFASILNKFIPTANAAPRIPAKPDGSTSVTILNPDGSMPAPTPKPLPKPSIQAKPTILPTPAKSPLENIFPQASAQVKGLMDLAKKFGQLTPEQLKAAAPKQKYEAKGIIPGIMKNMNASNQQLQDAMAELSGKKPFDKTPIAKSLAETDTGKAVAKWSDIFKKSFKLK